MSSNSTLVSAWSLGDVCDVIEDDQVELVEYCDGAFECEVDARQLQLLDQIGGSGEEGSVSALDESQSDGGGKMAFPDTARAEQQDIGTLSSQLSPAVIAVTRALEIIGTVSNSKLSSVFPGSRRASARWRWIRRRSCSVSSCSVMAARNRRPSP